MTLAMLSGLGCASHQVGYRSVAEAEVACAASNDCSDLSLKPGVKLSIWDECRAEALRRRCNFEDRCILECLLNGEAQNTGGGCWHVCANTFVKVRGKLHECETPDAPGLDACRQLTR